MLTVAGSVLVERKVRFCQSWRATANALESVAVVHNDLTLILDELSQCDPRDVGEACYMLANGSGKNRMKSAGGLRRKLIWRLLYLSSGNQSIGSHCSCGQATAGGHEVRLIIFLPMPGRIGCFENLHDFASGDKFSRHLQAEVNGMYGTSIRHFLNFIIGKRDPVAADLRKFVRSSSKNMLLMSQCEISRAAGDFYNRRSRRTRH